MGVTIGEVDCKSNKGDIQNLTALFFGILKLSWFRLSDTKGPFICKFQYSFHIWR